MIDAKTLVKPTQPNADGQTMCSARWMVETPAGWLAARDKEAFAAYAAQAVAAERERWESAIGAVMPQDFKLWRDSPTERPETAAWVITNTREHRDWAYRQMEIEHERLSALIADDASAATYQSLGQYRTAVLRSLRAANVARGEE